MYILDSRLRWMGQGTSKLEDLLEIYHLVRAEAMG